MKFDFVIGNPPYQETKEDTSDAPVYHYFMDNAFKIGKAVELITPARFLFNAGKTPKDWNEKILSNTHFKVIRYEQNSSDIFPNTDIKGGVAISYYDLSKKFGEIGVFSQFEQLRNISKKLRDTSLKNGIVDIIHLQNRFNLDKLYQDYPQFKNIISSNGNERRIVSSSFEKLPIFHNEKTSESEIKILGIVNSNSRQYRWVEQKYILDNGNLRKWKVLLPKSNGSGVIGEVLSTPLVGSPLVGYTQSFIGIGAFDSSEEANAVLKYVKSKFARCALGILKITQDNPPEKWKYVPLQDFTDKSDIDWLKSVREIDQQLYAKYGLSDDEIAFIERNVKEMA